MQKLAALLAVLLLCQVASADIEKWRFVTGAYVYSSPEQNGADAIFGSNDGAVYAVEVETGRMQRTFGTGGPVDNDPAVYGNAIYIGSEDGNLYALDAKTFDIKWQGATGGVWRSKALAANNRVYVGSVDGKLYAFHASNGALNWTFTTGGEINSGPAYYEPLNLVYIASSDGNLYGVDATTGVLQRTVKIGGLWLSSPVIGGKIIYVGSTDGTLYAVDAEKGGLVWIYRTGGSVLSTPSLVGDAVVFGSGDNNVYAVQKDSGDLLWKFRAGGAVQAQVAFAPDDAGSYTIYAGSLDGKVYALSAVNGSMKWSYDTGDWVGARPLPAGPMLIVPSYDNGVRGLSTVSCEFAAPEDGDTVGGGSIEAHGSAWSDEGVRGVEVRANGGQWLTATGTELWSIGIPQSGLAEGDLMLECRASSLSGSSERPPYNNVSVGFMADYAGKEISADYPRTEVPYGSDVVIRLRGPKGEPVFGAMAVWDGGNSVSSKNGTLVVKADRQGTMEVVVSAEGYADKSIKLGVGLNYTIYIVGAVVVLALAYFILVYRRKR